MSLVLELIEPKALLLAHGCWAALYKYLNPIQENKLRGWQFIWFYVDISDVEATSQRERKGRSKWSNRPTFQLTDIMWSSSGVILKRKLQRKIYKRFSDIWLMITRKTSDLDTETQNHDDKKYYNSFLTTPDQHQSVIIHLKH